MSNNLVTWENIRSKTRKRKLLIDVVQPYNLADYTYEDELVEFALKGIAKANQSRRFWVGSHLDKLYCVVNSFNTSFYEGYSKEDVKRLLEKFPHINKEKFDNALMGNTCVVVNEEMVMYRHYILTALRCGIENRDMYLWEWD